MSNCKLCGIELKPPRKKFCCNKHKDRYHNETNPRGMYAHLVNETDDNEMAACEAGWDGHKFWTSGND